MSKQIDSDLVKQIKELEQQSKILDHIAIGCFDEEANITALGRTIFLKLGSEGMREVIIPRFIESKTRTSSGQSFRDQDWVNKAMTNVDNLFRGRPYSYI